MKFIITAAGLLAALFLAGCGDSAKKLDGEIVKTKDGRYFQVKHHVGDIYFMRFIDIDKLKSDSEFID